MGQQDWKKKHYITHELSSPYNPESNGLAEAAVKNMKSLILRCVDRKENLSIAIAAWRNMARADGVSPAQLFYNRRMKQLLPILLAQSENAEIDVLARDEAAERVKNSNKCTDPRERAKFKPGQRVSVQDPISKKWSSTVIVLEEREHGNSYVLATEGTDKMFIRGQQLLKLHSVPKHSLVNTVPKELPTPYTPQVTRVKTKSYLEAVT